MAEQPGRAPSPPYTSWLTVEGFLDWLSEVGIPVQIDRSFWLGKYKEGTGSQLMAALRYLGLLDGEKPTGELEALVNSDTDERRRLVEAMLRQRYPTVLAMDLSRATPKMLDDAFSELGVEGHTSRKAQTFFLNACKFVGIPLAPGLSRKARSRRSGPPRRRQTRQKTDESANGSEESRPTTAQPSAPEQSTTIQLGSGGTLKLVLSANILTLDESDRRFINELVGRFQDYERGDGEEGVDHT